MQVQRRREIAALTRSAARYPEHLSLRVSPDLLIRIHWEALVRDQTVSEICRAVLDAHYTTPPEDSRGTPSDSR